MLKSKKKLNSGSLKIFHFLRLLYEDRAYYQDVVNIFKDEINEQSSNNIQVTLNKYINSLRVFGIKIEKKNNKYKLQSNLYTMNFTLGDLKSISILTAFAKNFPDVVIAEEINTIIKEIRMRMNSEDKSTLNMLENLSSYDFSFYYSGIKEQIENCEKLCKENRFLDVVYMKDGVETTCKGIAREVLYDSKNAYLKVHDSVKRQFLEIPLNNILHIIMRPNMVGGSDFNTSVTFLLKGRLAKTYKLKENECSQGFDENGNQIIVNKDEPFERLFARLMRYSDCCEVVQPKYLREDMEKLISDTIANYDEEE